ncbi:hypothetical protein ABXV03_08240 [Streptomyces harbinensis]|uniref:hypothetical protein n=1 Tax=Streptomyces harbinensis TaxID=1176198 RepID=UPI00339B7E51
MSASRSIRRTPSGELALPIRLSVNGEEAPDAEILLTTVQAEHLHAQLCRMLSDEPVPPGAPECRFDTKLDPRRTTRPTPSGVSDSPCAGH